MKRFLKDFYARHLKHISLTWEKDLHFIKRNKHLFKHIFKSKNSKFILILVLAAMIPITVMGVQTVQDVRQHAAGSTPPSECSGSSPIIVEPIQVKKFEKFTIKKAGGSFTESEFKNSINPGNGKFPDSDASRKCTFTGGNIVCTAMGTGGRVKPISKHNISNGSEVICEYRVEWVDDPTSSIGNKPKPPKQPSKSGSADCQANLSAGACTADKKPRLRASWNMKDDKPCSIKINNIEIETKCADTNMDLLTIGSTAIKDGETYKISIKGSNCDKKDVASATAPTCATSSPSGKKNSSGGNGNGTSSGSATLTAPGIDNSECKNGQETISWKSSSDAKTYTVSYWEKGTSNTKTKDNIPANTNTITLTDIKAGINYQYKITAVNGSKKADSSTSSFKCGKSTSTNSTTNSPARSTTLGGDWWNPFASGN